LGTVIQIAAVLCATFGSIFYARHPDNNLLDLLPMACLLFPVDALVLNVWLCVARYAIHDTEDAGRRQLGRSHSV
jgi:hypothetical protein